MDHLVLADGRRLDVRVTGPQGGFPFVFHHGTPGCALPLRSLERAVHARGLRMVTTSRPGYGDSTPRPGRRVGDVTEDTTAVLDAIGADRCLVAGGSGGGPHALACAARLPAAVAVLVIAGAAPFAAQGLDWLAGMGQDNIDEFTAAVKGEDALRPYLEATREKVKDANAEGLITALASVLPDVDRAVLTGEAGEDIAISMHEALRNGVEGWLEDDLAFVAPWGFDLAEIQVPVMIWQGSEDLMVPFGHGQWLAAHVPGATAHIKDGEGHLSIGIGAAGQMLDELASTAGLR